MAAPSYDPAHFIEDVRATYKADDPQTFWACEAALTRLLNGGVVASWLNEHLRALVQDPLYVGDWGPKEVVLHREGTWNLSVAMFDTPRRYIHSLPFYAFYVALSGANLTGDKYTLPDEFKNDVFDPGLRVRPAGVFSVPTGALMRLETDRFAYDFHFQKPLAVLRFATKPQRPLEWLFSKSSLQAWQANDADIAFTQLRVAAYVLGKLAHQSSIRSLTLLSAHPHHAVRWAAIQNLGRLSRTEALIKIREAVNDPHPHVRRAAQKTLDQIAKRT
jgi:hypothetical protein